MAHKLFSIATALSLFAFPAYGADILDSTPISQQAPAVDGINFTVGGNFGKFDDAENHMFVGSMAMQMPFMPESFGIQADVAAGIYDSDYTSAAGGLHLFWRDPSVGMLGVYGDWVFTSPEHSGRVAAEFAVYNNRWSLDGLVGMRFGQNVNDTVFDEIDLSYYFTDNFRGSVGHRYNARGNVGNISFEAMFDDPSFAGWSVFGEAETGEDDYSAGFAGIRYSFGASNANTKLIERDRYAGVKIRIPRSLADITQCGSLSDQASTVPWRVRKSTLCASKDELEDEDAVIEKR